MNILKSQNQIPHGVALPPLLAFCLASLVFRIRVGGKWDGSAHVLPCRAAGLSLHALSHICGGKARVVTIVSR